MVAAKVILPEHSRMERLRRTRLILWGRSTAGPATREEVGGATGYRSGRYPAPFFSPWALPPRPGTFAARCRHRESPSIPRSLMTAAPSWILPEPTETDSISIGITTRNASLRLRYPGEKSRRCQWRCHFPGLTMFLRTGPLFSLPRTMEVMWSLWNVEVPAGSLRRLLTDTWVVPPQPGPLTGSLWSTARETETSMSSGAMEQELESSPLWAACQTHSAGRQTAVKFGFPGTIGFGRCRRMERDSTRYCLAGAPRPRSAVAVGLRWEILRIPVTRRFLCL